MGNIEENNKELVYKTVEAINKGKYDIIPETTDPNFIFHYSLEQDIPDPRREGEIEASIEFHKAFPDIHHTIEDIIAEGDTVVSRYRTTATHTGSDWMGIPATGKRVVTEGIIISRFKDGKEIERWECIDRFRNYVQRGVIPPLEEIQRLQKQKQTEEENKKIVRRFLLELYGNGNLSVVDELLDPDYTTAGGFFKGAESVKQFEIQNRNAFPDLHVEIEKIVAEGDTVSVILNSEGTFTGKFNDIEPTGNRFKFQEALFYTLREGKIILGKEVADLHSLYEQLGIPQPKQ